ncbi:MAG TPA: tetratricopeptide repeat protein [Burkholderiales bacterium]
MFRSDSTALALLAIAVLLFNFTALTASFQFDDYNVIVNNPAVHSLAAWLDSMPGIRPLLKLSYALNWVAGAGPFGFHLFNVVVHGANALLVFLLLRTLRPGRGREDLLPLLAALMFALHPAQTEAVTYIAGRSVSFMALLYLGGILAYLRADASPSPWNWRLFSAALFAAALLVKETAVTLPLALLVVESVGARRSMRERLKRQSFHLLVLAGGLIAIAASPVYRHLLEVSLATRGLGENLLTQINAICYLAGQLLFPWRLNADPDLPVISAITPVTAMQALALVAILAIGLRNLREQRWIAFAVLWFFVHLLPTNSIVPRLDVANDRQLYLACIGAFVAVAAALQWLLSRLRRRWLVNAAAGLLLVGLGALTMHRNQVYETQVAFWEDAAAKSPRKPRVFNNLGYVHQQEGRFGDARLAYLRALELDPGYWRARINLSTLPEPSGNVEGR